MSSESEYSFAQARSYCAIGQFAQAVDVLEKMLATESPSVSLAIELGETLLTQGYPARAVEVLERHLPAVDDIRDAEAAGGRLVCFLARVRATARFKEDIQTATDIFNRYSSGPSSQATETSLRIDKYFCSLLRLAREHAGPDGFMDPKEVLPRLESAFDSFVGQKDFYNAFSAAATHCNCSADSDTSLLRKLIEAEQHTPKLYVAKAQVLLASKMDGQGIDLEQIQLLQAAKGAFEDDGHVLGALDAMIKISCRSNVESQQPSFDEIIPRLFEEYNQLDYPAGLLSAYLEFCQVASRLSAADIHTSLWFEVEKICASSGSTLAGHIARSANLNLAASYGDNYATVIESASAMWYSLVESDCANLRSQAALAVAVAYNFLSERRLAGEWRKRAAQDSSGLGAVRVPPWVDKGSTDASQYWDERYKEFFHCFQKEKDRGSTDAAFDELENFLNQALSTPVSSEEDFDVLDRALLLAEQTIGRLPQGPAATKRLAKLRSSQAALLTRKATPRPDVVFESDAMNILNEAKHLYLKLGMVMEAALVLQHQALLQIGCFQKFEKYGHPLAKKALQDALNSYEIVFNSALQLGRFYIVKENAYWIAHCRFRQWERGWADAELVLANLRQAESLVDQERQELSILQKIEAVTIKRNLASNLHYRQLYQWAVQILFQQKEPIRAWEWIQRSKARSLSDFLGLGAVVPEELLSRINNSAEMQGIFGNEQNLLRELMASAESDRYELRKRLAQVQTEMKKHGELEELLKLRQGDPVSYSELRTISSNQPNDRWWKRIVFVDWVLTLGAIRMLVVTNTGEIVARDLAITVAFVENWASRHLRGTDSPAPHPVYPNRFSGLKREDDEDFGPLRQLDELILPLVDLSEPEDLLVLCPSGILHSIPLHALRLGSAGQRQVLIERNPVVYCASLTSFAQCCKKASLGATQKPPTGQFLAVYESHGEDQQEDESFTFAEQRDIYASVRLLAETFAGDVLVGPAVTPDSLQDSLESSSFVHFIGHCDFDPERMSDQSLQISARGSDSDTHNTTARFSVDDLLSLRVKSPHISLLGCGTASQDYTPGDEPLGLVTAFLAAGASSVLGTLWPIQSRTALRFSERFYSYIEQGNFAGGSLCDLAYASRAAALELMADWEFRNPYHWAAFVLHGSWFF